MQAKRIQSILLVVLLLLGGLAKGQVVLMEKNFDFKCKTKAKEADKEAKERTFSFKYTAKRTDEGKFEFFLVQNSKVNEGNKEIDPNENAADTDSSKGRFSMETLSDQFGSFEAQLAVLFRQYQCDSCLDIGKDGNQDIAKHSIFKEIANKLFFETVAYAAVQDDKTAVAGTLKVNLYIPMFERTAMGYKRRLLNAMWDQEEAKIKKLKAEDALLKKQNKERKAKENKDKENKPQLTAIPFDKIERIIVYYEPDSTVSMDSVKIYAASHKIETVKETKIWEGDPFDPFSDRKWTGKYKYSFRKIFEPGKAVSFPFPGQITRIDFDPGLYAWQDTTLKTIYKFNFRNGYDDVTDARFNCVPNSQYLMFDPYRGIKIEKTSYQFSSFFLKTQEGFDPFSPNESQKPKTHRYIFATKENLKDFNPEDKKSTPKPSLTPLTWTRNGQDTTIKGKDLHLSTEGTRIVEFENDGKDLLQAPSLQSPFYVENRKTRITPIYVKSVQFEFRNGMLENIVVSAVAEGDEKHELKFTNGLPIGFSTQKNIDEIDQYWLFEDNHDEHAIRLSDLMDYRQNLNLAGKDYSPKNQVITVTPHITTTVMKEETSQLFEAKVFSDVLGFDADNPQGLVQTEVSKRIDLYTRRWQMLGDPRLMNFSIITYLEPTVALSKVEDKNFFLTAQHTKQILSGEVKRDSYVSTMDLLNYENFSAGIDLNFFIVDFKQFKTELMFDGGARFGRTGIRDTLFSLSAQNTIVPREKLDDYIVNTFRWYPKATAQFFPDSRWGLRLSYQFNMVYLLSNRVRQVANLEVYENLQKEGAPHPTHRLEMMAHFQPGQAGRFFFRYSFNWQAANVKTNFNQAQLGYSFFLTTRKIEKINEKDQ